MDEFENKFDNAENNDLTESKPMAEEAESQSTDNFGQESSFYYSSGTEQDSNQQYNANSQSSYQPQYSNPYQSSYQYQNQNQPYNYQSYNPNFYPPVNNNSAEIKTKAKKKTGFRIFVVLMAVIILITGSCFATIGIMTARKSNPDTKTEESVVHDDDTSMKISPTPDQESKNTSATGILSPVQIAEKVKPTVVGITVYANKNGQIASEGSGVIMSSDSTGEYMYIVTCAHVISNSGVTFSVQTEGGKRYDATRVGYDARTDVGVLKIKAKGLPTATFGDSTKVKVGESVYAIGNPGGSEFFGSFTGGMVSAIDRSVQSNYTMVCIQHDAAINPGNSGGVLVNVYGQVIGINSLKIIANEYEGMGFAIPITTAKSVVDNLIKFGYVPNRPKIGILYASVSNSQQYSMIVQIKGLPAGSLIISEISPDSSLAKTSARVNDMIIKVDGKDMVDSSVLLDKIEKGKVGDKLKLTLCRVSSNYQTSEFDVDITLVEDKNDSNTSEQTTTPDPGIDPFDFFQNPYGN